MLDALSPYALLCASKPKPAPSFSTRYDLYSAAQQSEPQANGDAAPQAQMPLMHANDTPASGQAANRTPANAEAKKTHYISDIHTRHHQAIRHATFTNRPIP